MPVHAVAITKQVGFRGVQQEFTNVYHYNGTALGGPQAQAVAEQVRNKEQPLHSTDVSFVRGRVWSAGGSSAANQMIWQGSLSGVGTQATNSSMDRERAVLVRFANGLDSRGRPKYLRKWYHSCGSCAGVSFATAGILQNTATIPALDRATIVAAVDDLLVNDASGWNGVLCSPRGAAGGTPVECHAYLEHHQLGDMWRQ